MIIVSQKGDLILNFDNAMDIHIDTKETHRKIYAIGSIQVQYMLGEYKTEKRAKEVLDEIVNTRAIAEIYKCSNDNTQDIVDKKMLEENLIFDTYEMPEE